MAISGAAKYIRTTPGLWEVVRGDSDETEVRISFNGVPYTFVTGDKLAVTIKPSLDAETETLYKEYTASSVTLVPSDTSAMETGEYVYDLKLMLASGLRRTVISQGKFILKKEVTSNG